MIHVEALPGTPRYKNNISEIIEKALKEADIYKKAGIDALAIENMHDIPYIKTNIGPEITALMSVIGYEIKKASNLDFIRAEGFVFAHVADEGIMESCAGELLRYRKMINADNILVFTDIKKSTVHMLLQLMLIFAKQLKPLNIFLVMA